jgi:hypothetical protein
MDGISIIQVVLLVALAVVVFAGRRFLGPHADASERVLSQLRDELMGRTPVFSAETTKRNEAEFIGDRLPSRWPVWVVLLVVVLGGAIIWWLMR